jgi:CHASE3 domain sensor protein
MKPHECNCDDCQTAKAQARAIKWTLGILAVITLAVVVVVVAVHFAK